MKKLLLTLIASFAVIQSAHAIPSNLGESMRVLHEIQSSETLNKAISPAEYIISIRRITKDIHQDSAYYEIKTYAPKAKEETLDEKADCCPYEKRKHTIKKYRVELKFTPNQNIGPKNVEVVNIESLQ